MSRLNNRGVLIRATLVLIAMLGTTPAGAAQTVTTGTLTGTISDPQGGVLPGATITAIHEPTGTRYEAVTGGAGRFLVPNVRVGGPYTVTARLSGFRDQTQSNVAVALGEERIVDFKLALASVAEAEGRRLRMPGAADGR